MPTCLACWEVRLLTCAGEADRFTRGFPPGVARCDRQDGLITAIAMANA